MEEDESINDFLAPEYYQGRGEDADVEGGSTFDVRADMVEEDMTVEDAEEELYWLEDAMKSLEAGIMEAEKNCLRWTSSRGVSSEALKEIYGYLTEDMANECVRVWLCGSVRRVCVVECVVCRRGPGVLLAFAGLGTRAILFAS